MVTKTNDGGLIEKFFRWAEQLPGSMALFGCGDLCRALVAKYPERFQCVVEMDGKLAGGRIGTVRVLSLDDYLLEPTKNILITDADRQLDYLDWIYRNVMPPNLGDLGRIEIRYHHTWRPAEQYDRKLARTKAALPMVGTLPDQSLMRLMDCVETCLPLAGDVLEIGTGMGGSAFVIASVIEQSGRRKKVYTLDRFTPVSYLPDLNYDQVRKDLERFEFVTVIQGTIPRVFDTLEIGPVSFCFIDMFAFPEILEFVYPRMNPGGMILIDNYNHGADHIHGIPVADYFFHDKPERIIRVGGTQGLLVKHP